MKRALFLIVLSFSYSLTKVSDTKKDYSSLLPIERRRAPLPTLLSPGISKQEIEHYKNSIIKLIQPLSVRSCKKSCSQKQLMTTIERISSEYNAHSEEITNLRMSVENLKQIIVKCPQYTAQLKRIEALLSKEPLQAKELQALIKALKITVTQTYTSLAEQDKKEFQALLTSLSQVSSVLKKQLASLKVQEQKQTNQILQELTKLNFNQALNQVTTSLTALQTQGAQNTKQILANLTKVMTVIDKLDKKERAGLTQVKKLLSGINSSIMRNESLLQQLQHTLNNKFNDVTRRLTAGPFILITAQELPYTITSPGYYFLDDDISLANITASGPLIQITNTSNVVLDLNLHTLDLNETGAVGLALKNTAAVTITNGTIQNSLIDTSGHGIAVEDNCRNITIKNMVISKCATGIKVSSSSCIALERCFIDHGIRGISCNSSSQCIIDSCSFLNNSSGGVVCSGTTTIPAVGMKVINTTVSNTTINADTTHPTYGILFNEVTNACVENTVLDQNTYGIVISNGADITVQETKVLNSGNTALFVFPATNTEATNNRGLCFDHLLIDAKDQMTGYRGIELQSVSNAKIMHAQIVGVPSSALFLSNCNAISIEHSLLSNALSASDPVVQFGDGNFFVSECTLVDCTITNPLTVAPLNSLYMFTADGIVVKDCIIRATGQDQGFNGNGILLAGQVTNTLIKNCTITYAGANGITIAQTVQGGANEGITIEGCKLYELNQNGIQISNAQNCTIKECEIKRCQSGIIVSSAQSIMLLNNIINNNDVVGISLDVNTTDCLVQNNTLYDNWSDITGQGTAINNQNVSNQIYHNFAFNSTTNYVGQVPLVVAAGPNIGVLENINMP